MSAALSADYMHFLKRNISLVFPNNFRSEPILRDYVTKSNEIYSSLYLHILYIYIYILIILVHVL